jgi:hypothetical protein
MRLLIKDMRDMQSHAEYRLLLVKQRRAQQFREAAEARLVPRQSHSIRRSVGQSIVRITAHLAGEPRVARMMPATRETTAGLARR